jgi:peptidoglycan/xylan/chitin deacetylase (PgdA/CDA1 family)
MIKKTLESTIKKFRIYTLLSPWYSGCGSILMFHRLCKAGEKSSINSNSALEVTPEYLEEIILFFNKKGYDFISIGDVPRILNTGKQAHKFVVFTFDDGYTDNYTLAYPIFRKHKVPFTIYVATSFPDRTAVLWWYMLDELLSNNIIIEFDANGTHYRFACPDVQARESAFVSIRAIIMKCNASSFPCVLQAIFQKYGIDPKKTSNRLAIGWNMLREMSKDRLVTIGAHTVNHISLRNLSEAELYHEIVHSKNLIESNIGLPVKTFSYPFGGEKEAGIREFEAVKKTGFDTGTTTRLSNVFKQHKGCLEALPRWNVDGNNEDVGELEYVSGYAPFIRNFGK